MGAWWQEVGLVVQEEFSDLSDAARWTRIVLRLLVAAVLGAFVGFQRERAGKAAGLRTHMLVAVGAALFILIPDQAGMSHAELSRVVQGVITGVGFLGAGMILKTENGQVQGLTTAAGIWLTAAVGVAAGLGREASAILGTLLALAILAVLVRIELWMGTPGNREDR